MKTIWKFPLSSEGEQLIKMPQGCAVLCAQVQHDIPCVWAVVDTDAPTVKRRFRIFGTGHPINEDDLQFVGTFQLSGGGLVFHLYMDGQEY